MVLVGLGAISMLGGVAVGASLRWAGSLALAFQGIVLGGYVVAVAFTLFGPAPNQLFSGVLATIAELWREGGAAPQQLDLVSDWGATLFGGMVGVTCAQLVGALLLGRWWAQLARKEIGFGVEFRALKLGRVLGIPGMILVGVDLVWDAPAVQILVPTALFGFLFPGLAVLHAWAHAKNWHAGLIVPAYILLIPPLTAVGVLGLSVVGLVDNLFDLRSSLRAQT